LDADAECGRAHLIEEFGKEYHMVSISTPDYDQDKLRRLDSSMSTD
jgi:hypothetical protein